MQSFGKIRYALVFNRLGRLNRFDEGLIQIRAYQGRRYRLFSTGLHVAPKHWSERTQRVKISHPNHFVHNQRIMEQLQLMEAFEIRMINRYGGLSIDRLHEYESTDLQELPRSFTEFYREELEAIGYKPSSHKMYQLTLNKLTAFRKVIYFEDLTYKTILDFDRWLKRQRGIGSNSIYKHHVRFRTFIKAAIRHDYMKADNDPYIRFRPARGEEPNRPYLNADELTSLEALNLESDVLARVRDLFLLCCYTGLRFGDAIRLNVSNIEQRTKGLVLRTVAEKTDKPLELPLYFLFQDGHPDGSRPERIIKKYLAELGQLAGCTGAERIRFFPYTNQYVNRTLKEMAELAGIKKKVSTHVARRTFGTQMATRVKSPILQKLMQHSRPDMTAIYIQLGNGEIETELEKIQWEKRKK